MYRKIIISTTTVLLLSCSKDYSICFQGNVSDAGTGKGISGASVDLIRDDEWGDNSYYTSVATDENGNYSLSFDNNDDLSNFNIFVSKKGYEDTLLNVSERKKECVTVNIQLFSE